MNTVDGLSKSRRISLVAKNESCATQSALETVQEAQILSWINGIFWNACFSSFIKRNREPAGKRFSNKATHSPPYNYLSLQEGNILSL